MTKQEEIREKVIVNIVKACPDMLNRDVAKLADKILKDEDFQGVVIKVERELPKNPYSLDYDKLPLEFQDEATGEDVYLMHYNGIEKGMGLMREAGCGFFEPLI